jgi:hypothetical protein
MDLIGGYLLVILILFAANIGLLFGNFKFSNVKLVGISAMFFVATFVIMYASDFLNNSLSFMMEYFSYLFFVIFLVLIVSVMIYIKNDKFKPALYLILPVSLITTIFLSSQADSNIISIILYSLCVFIILFVVYQLSKLLHHAKRQYPIIIGEYMCLFSVLMFIFALTYNSARALDYSAFSPFLILTPTYQLIYVIIAVIVILIGGVLVNDNKGGNS